MNGVHQPPVNDPSHHQAYPGQQPGVSGTPVDYSVTNQTQMTPEYGAVYPEALVPPSMSGQSQPGSAVSGGYMTPGQPQQHLGGDPMYAQGYFGGNTNGLAFNGYQQHAGTPFNDGNALTPQDPNYFTPSVHNQPMPSSGQSRGSTATGTTWRGHPINMSGVSNPPDPHGQHHGNPAPVTPQPQQQQGNSNMPQGTGNTGSTAHPSAS